MAEESEKEAVTEENVLTEQVSSVPGDEEIEFPEGMQEMFTMELTEAESEQIKTRLGHEVTWLTVTNIPGMAEQTQDDRLAGGPEAVARLFSTLDQRMTTVLLRRIEDGGRRLVEQMKRLMFPFNDLIHLRNLDLELVLRGIENSTIAMAVRTAPEEVKQRIFACVPSAKRTRIEEEIELLGPIPEDDGTQETQERVNRVHREIEAAQGMVVSAILDAERQKKIKIVRPG